MWLLQSDHVSSLEEAADPSSLGEVPVGSQRDQPPYVPGGDEACNLPPTSAEELRKVSHGVALGQLTP
eukprot:12679782-Alexandrium_andersonii.AAC.1